MDTTDAIYDGLKDAGIDFVVSVPCFNLSKLLVAIDEDSEITHVPVNREEEGINSCCLTGANRTGGVLKGKSLTARVLG